MDRRTLLMLLLLLCGALRDPEAGTSAEPGLQVRVLSYNIHHGEGNDRRVDLARIARLISAAHPDVVALQEVDQNTARTGHVDQPQELARLTGMQFVFGRNIDLEGGGYGNAVLSRLPVRRHNNHLLPRTDNGEQRGVLEVELDFGQPAPPLRFLATHFDHRRADRERLASAAAVEALLANRPAQPTILAGDFNARPKSRVLKLLRRTWRSANAGQRLLTFPAGAPNRQLDYVLTRPTHQWKVVAVQVLDEQAASDHRPILAVLELRR